MSEYPVTDESEEPGQFADRYPIPVHIEEDVTPVRPACAERASYNTYFMSFTDVAPKRILPRAPNRTEAVLYLATLNNAPLPLIGFDQAAIVDGAGFNMAGLGITITLKTQREVWAWGLNRANGTFTISVLDQFYDQ